MKTEIETQNENINELIRLAKENPTLKIIPMVDSDIGNPDFSWMVGQWGKASIDEIYIDNEHVRIRLDDVAYLIDELMDDDETLDELNAQAIVDNYEWEKVIMVNINTL